MMEMRKTKIYLLWHGDFGDDGFICKIYKHKKDALAHIKEKGGYKRNKDREEPFFEDFDGADWYRIDEGELFVD